MVLLVMGSVGIACNGFGLCEEGELEAQMFNKPQMLIEVQMFNLALLPLFRKTLVTCWRSVVQVIFSLLIYTGQMTFLSM